MRLCEANKIRVTFVAIKKDNIFDFHRLLAFRNDKARQGALNKQKLFETFD